MQEKLFLKNSLHLGDCLFQLNWCRKILRTYPNLEIDFYIRDENIDEIKLHSKDLNINILNISNVPDDAFNTNLDSNGVYKEYLEDCKLKNVKPHQDIFYCKFFERLSNNLKLENPIQIPDDFLYEHPLIKETKEIYYDYLIINSRARSNQYPNSETEFKNLIKFLKNKNKKIITTEKTVYNDIESTRNLGYNLLDIGKLSLHCNNIISVNTAPIIPCLNKYIKDRKNIFILSKNFTYSYENVIHIDTNFQKIYEYL